MRVYFVQKALQLCVAWVLLYLLLSKNELCEVNPKGQSENTSVVRHDVECKPGNYRQLFTYEPKKNTPEVAESGNRTDEKTQDVDDNMTNVTEADGEANATMGEHPRKKRAVGATDENEKVWPLQNEDKMVENGAAVDSSPEASKKSRKSVDQSSADAESTASTGIPALLEKKAEETTEIPEKTTTVEEKKPASEESKENKVEPSVSDLTTVKTVEKVEEKQDSEKANASEAEILEELTTAATEHDATNEQDKDSKPDIEIPRGDDVTSDVTSTGATTGTRLNSDKWITLTVKRCMQIDEGDIVGWSDHKFLPLLMREMRAPVIFLALAIVCLVGNVIHVFISFTEPKQFTVVMSNIVQVMLWGMSGVALALFEAGWDKDWKDNTNFRPTFPCQWTAVMVACFVMMFVFVLETYFYEMLQYNIYAEKSAGVYKVIDYHHGYTCSVATQRINDDDKEIA